MSFPITCTHTQTQPSYPLVILEQVTLIEYILKEAVTLPKAILNEFPWQPVRCRYIRSLPVTLVGVLSSNGKKHMVLPTLSGFLYKKAAVRMQTYGEYEMIVEQNTWGLK